MLQIAIIKPNAFGFEKMSYDDICGQTLENTLKQFIDIITIDNSTNELLLKNIIENIEKPTDDTIRSYKCFETSTSSAYLMYISGESISNNETNTNNIARFLSEKHEPVIGKCVVLNTSTSTNIDIKYDDVIKIIRNRLIHKVITLSHSGEIIETNYTTNPIENTQLKSDNCRCYQIEFLNKILCVFMEMSPMENSINKYATLLCRKMKVAGDVVISILTKYPTLEIMDIDSELIKKILCVRSNVSSSELDKISEDVIRGNFYNILEQYASKYNNAINENIPDDVLGGQTMNSTLQ